MIIFIKEILLFGVISPNPTVDSIVAPQYHPTIYFSKSESKTMPLSSTQVGVIFKWISRMANKFKAIERKCINIPILNKSSKIYKIVSACVDRQRRLYIFYQVSLIYEKDIIVTNLIKDWRTFIELIYGKNWRVTIIKNMLSLNSFSFLYIDCISFRFEIY